MRNTVFGIFAHVDAGKTTLSEQLLLRGGVIKEAGRVDKGTSYLDDNSIERERGITVFSKQARLKLSGRPFTLLDTPGHSDLTEEARSVLSVLDAAILIVPSGNGVNEHTEYLKKLLSLYKLPVIIFVNKVDLPSFDREGLLLDIKERLGEGCIEADRLESGEAAEDIAVLDDELLKEYLDFGKLPENFKEKLFLSGKLFPVYFGSALKNEGIDELCEGLSFFTAPLLKKAFDQLPFGARVFSIAHSDRRLTFMRITSGVLKIRDQIETDASLPPQKITELRLYSGSRFERTSEAHSGDIVAAAGLDKTFAGQGLGNEEDEIRPPLRESVRVRIITDPSVERKKFLNALSILSEEEPYLEIETKGEGEDYLSINGTLQEEILSSLFKERFGIAVSFEDERILDQEDNSDAYTEEETENAFGENDPAEWKVHESRDVKTIMDGLGRSANQKEKPRGRDRDIEKKRQRENELTIKRALDEKKMPYEGKERVDLHIVEKSDLLLVDGYNIIFSWDELKELSKVSIDAARGRLNDILSNYAAFVGCETIVVYDAYLLEGHSTEILKYNNIHIVFTKTAETADQYIEKTAIKRKNDAFIRVATSDMVERMIVLSQGAVVITAENFRGMIDAAEREIRDKI